MHVTCVIGTKVSFTVMSKMHINLWLDAKRNGGVMLNGQEETNIWMHEWENTGIGF
jgi:hypothetical protein